MNKAWIALSFLLLFSMSLTIALNQGETKTLGERFIVNNLQPQDNRDDLWQIDMVERLREVMPNFSERDHFLNEEKYIAQAVGLDPQLVLAVIEIESRFNRFAISKAGAIGLMQVMPFWVGLIGMPNDDLFDAATNLRYGCIILKYYLELENGDLTRALARYNGSQAEDVYPRKVLKALQKKLF